MQVHGAVQVKRLRPFSQMMVQRVSSGPGFQLVQVPQLVPSLLLASHWRLFPALPLVCSWFRFCPLALTLGFSWLASHSLRARKQQVISLGHGTLNDLIR